MPFESPSDAALSRAYDEIMRAAPAVSSDDPDALRRMENLLRLLALEIGEWLYPCKEGRLSGAELAALRAFAIDRGGRIAAHLGTSVATGSIRDVPMPTAEGLPGLVREYAPEARATADLVEDGVDPDQAVIEQFASPFMDFGAKSVALGNQPEDFLVRAGLGAIGAAAALVAAIDHRPPYRHAD